MSTTDTRNTLLQEVHADEDRDFLQKHRANVKCDPLAKIVTFREEESPKHGKVVNRGFVPMVSDLAPARETGMRVRGKSKKSMMGQVNETQERALNNIERANRKYTAPDNKNMILASAMLKAFLDN